MERDKSREIRCMNQPLTIEELVSIHKLMQSMLHVAESGDWQALSQLDAQRRQLIDQNYTSSSSKQPHFALNTVVNKQDTLSYDALCKIILQTDAKITETVKTAKQQLVEENRSMRNQVVAKNGYAQTATMNTSSYNLK
jgi:hypothetical protein